MKVLVEDLVLLARLDAARGPDRTAFDLRLWPLTPAVTPWRCARGGSITLVAPEPVIVWGDEAHLRQAIGNLVTDARDLVTPRRARPSRFGPSWPGARPGWWSATTGRDWTTRLLALTPSNGSGSGTERGRGVVRDSVWPLWPRLRPSLYSVGVSWTRVAGSPNLAGVLIHLQVFERQPPARRSDARGPPQHRLYPLDELLDAERLGHVIVAAQTQTFRSCRAVVTLAVRKMTGTRVPAPSVWRSLLATVEPIEIGQHHVQHHQIGTLSLDRGQRRPPGSRCVRPRNRPWTTPSTNNSVMCSSSSTTSTRGVPVLVITATPRHFPG